MGARDRLGGGVIGTDLVTLSLADAGTIVQIVGTSVQALALVIAGVWAYYRFAKGRGFFARADFSIELRRLHLPDRDLIQVKAVLRNAGGAELLLAERPVIQRLSFLPATGAVLGSPPSWHQVPPPDGHAAELFAGHRMIEPAETVRDETLIPLPNLGPAAQPLAWRVGLELQIKRRSIRRSRRYVVWQAAAILVPEPRPDREEHPDGR
jgi:hypothetical protein